MEGAGHQLFSGSRLSCDQDGRRAVRHPLDQILDMDKGAAGSDEPLKGAGFRKIFIKFIGQSHQNRVEMILRVNGTGGHLGGIFSNGSLLFKQIVSGGDPAGHVLAENLPETGGRHVAEFQHLISQAVVAEHDSVGVGQEKGLLAQGHQAFYQLFRVCGCASLGKLLEILPDQTGKLGDGV